MHFFSITGFVTVVMILLPNILYMFTAKKQTNKSEIKNDIPKVIYILENIGRYACLILMIINTGFLETGYIGPNAQPLRIILSIILTVLYLFAWLIYFTELKFTLPLCLALSVIPSLLFFLSGLLCGKWTLLFFSVIFAVCHIYISYKSAPKEILIKEDA